VKTSNLTILTVVLYQHALERYLPELRKKCKGRRMKKWLTNRRDGEGMRETGGKRINVRKG
jgi:hypothetical protein